MANYEKATLAGGCFWGMQDLIRKQDGVIDTVVGYTGGTTKDPLYPQVKTGTTGHAESIEILFDPEKLSYERILDFFFQIHDPTTTDRQGNDIGSQYRSAIFYHNEQQRQAALRAVEKYESDQYWGKDIVTEITEATEFYPAEDDHQDYLEKYPEGYTCHFIRSF